MEKIDKEITVTRYRAFDGTEFEYEDQCHHYETKLKYEAFKYDPDQVTVLNEDNYQHFIEYFIRTFFTVFPGKEYMFSDEYKDLEKLRRFFMKYTLNDKYVYRRYESKINGGKTTYSIYSFAVLLDFLFIKCECKIEHLEQPYVNRRNVPVDGAVGSLPPLSPDEAHKFFSNHFFSIAKADDDLVAFDILLNHTSLDMNHYLEETYALQEDFFTRLVLKARTDTKHKWVEYFVKLDPELKLFNTITDTVTVTDENSEYSTRIYNAKSEDITFKINLDYLKELLFEYDQSKREFVVADINKATYEILDKAGPNLNNLSDDVPEMIKLVSKTLRELAVITHHSQEKLEFLHRKSVTFTPSDRPKYLTSLKHIAHFCIPAIRRHYDKAPDKNVCVIKSYSETPGRLPSEKEVKVLHIIDLDEYKDNPQGLATKLLHCLKDDNPEMIQIQDEIYDLEKRLEELRSKKVNLKYK